MKHCSKVIKRRLKIALAFRCCSGLKAALRPLEKASRILGCINNGMLSKSQEIIDLFCSELVWLRNTRSNTLNKIGKLESASSSATRMMRDLDTKSGNAETAGFFNPAAREI